MRPAPPDVDSGGANALPPTAPDQESDCISHPGSNLRRLADTAREEYVENGKSARPGLLVVQAPDQRTRGGPKDVLELDHGVRELVERQPEQHPRRQRSQVDLDAELLAVVLGYQSAVVKPRYERTVSVPLARLLRVQRGAVALGSES